MKLSILALCAATAVAHDGLPVNPMLGVPGYPDCFLPKELQRAAANGTLSVDEAAHALVCRQRQGDSDDTIKVGCIGACVVLCSFSVALSVCGERGEKQGFSFVCLR